MEGGYWVHHSVLSMLHEFNKGNLACIVLSRLGASRQNRRKHRGLHWTTVVVCNYPMKGMLTFFEHAAVRRIDSISKRL